MDGKSALTRRRVFVSTDLRETPAAELAASFELIATPVDCDGLVAMPTDAVDAALLDRAGPTLRIVANHAVGLDNVDVAAATARGVVVTNTPNVLTPATAELTIGLALAVVRRIAEGDRLVRSGIAWRWSPTFFLGRSLRGRTLGIVGLGRIGTEVARLGEALGMRVVHSGGRGPWKPLELPDLLGCADVVTLHVPLTPQTRHLIGREELGAMRCDANLVNASRGPVVDEAALAEALAAGEIAGAALDVYEREPEVHAGLVGLPNVVLTPHLGSATEEARDAMGMVCVEALRVVLLEGCVPPNAVNPKAFRPAR